MAVMPVHESAISPLCQPLLWCISAYMVKSVWASHS